MIKQITRKAKHEIIEGSEESAQIGNKVALEYSEFKAKSKQKNLVITRQLLKKILPV